MLVEFRIRLPVKLADLVVELAHAARLPRALFLRDVVADALGDGRHPMPAVVAVAAPSAASTAALGVLAPVVSNLSQLDGHARAAGGVLAAEKFLFAVAGWADQARDLAAALRAGCLNDTAAALLVERLAEPGVLVNGLAHRLNLSGSAGEPGPAAPEWGAALQPLRAAFAALAAEAGA